MTFPLYPIWAVDLLGSSLMIVFSFLCLRLVKRLKQQSRGNIVWAYMLWLCYSLALFAVSRSVGHIAQRILIATGATPVWEAVRPYSGSINTLTFVVVASITLFFERTWKVYEQISEDRKALQEAHERLLFLNRNLEDLVADRTREVAFSERKYRRIFEVSRDMIVVTGRDGGILDINPEGLQMLGTEPSHGLPPGARLQDFFCTPEDWQALQRELDSTGYVVDAEVEFLGRNGLQMSTLISCTAEQDSNGCIDSIHFLAKDISRRKEMEKQLMRADKLASIGQLAAGIAHEINNPLGMILGYTQLLLRNEAEGTERRADLKIIEKHTRTCKAIVGDLLSFARSTRTRKEIANLNSAVEGILSVVQHHFQLDGVNIEREFDPQMPQMVFDEEKIKQVFMNLIMNAKQAIGKKGMVRIATRFDKIHGQALVEVTDTGTGIAPELMGRIFDPFFTTKPTGEGTGLGLSVSYGIVKDHGGEIFVESEPNRGTMFTVVLPVHTEQPGEGLTEAERS